IHPCTRSGYLCTVNQTGILCWSFFPIPEGVHHVHYVLNTSRGGGTHLRSFRKHLRGTQQLFYVVPYPLLGYGFHVVVTLYSFQFHRSRCSCCLGITLRSMYVKLSPK